MKEEAVAVVSKEQLNFLKQTGQDNDYTDFLVKQLSSQLAERTIQVLLHEREIVASLSDLRVEEYNIPTNSVRYSRQFEWRPLVRCKDCIHNPDRSDEVVCPFVYSDGYVEAFPDDDGFCYKGERSEI